MYPARSEDDPQIKKAGVYSPVKSKINPPTRGPRRPPKRPIWVTPRIEPRERVPKERPVSATTMGIQLP